jgi:hypothetical protein
MGSVIELTITGTSAQPLKYDETYGRRMRIYRAKIGPNFWTGCSSAPNSADVKRPDQQKR